MKKDGFTLIELMVVIAIIGILTAIAALGYTRWTTRFKVEQQIKEMYADLMEARTKAMTRNSSHIVTLSATQYEIRDDTDDDGVSETTDTLVTQITLKYQIAWNGTGNQITFNSRGLSNNERTISVSVTTDASYDCIVVSTTRINIGKMSGGSCGQK